MLSASGQALESWDYPESQAPEEYYDCQKCFHAENLIINDVINTMNSLLRRFAERCNIRDAILEMNCVGCFEDFMELRDEVEKAKKERRKNGAEPIAKASETSESEPNSRQSLPLHH